MAYLYLGIELPFLTLWHELSIYIFKFSLLLSFITGLFDLVNRVTGPLCISWVELLDWWALCMMHSATSCNWFCSKLDDTIFFHLMTWCGWVVGMCAYICAWGWIGLGSWGTPNKLFVTLISGSWVDSILFKSCKVIMMVWRLDSGFIFADMD